MKKIMYTGLVSMVFLTGCEQTPRVIDELSTFHHPESCAVSLDKKNLFVSNCGSGFFGEDQVFGLERGAGAVSKLAIRPDGTLEPVDLGFVTNITAPLGMAVLPVATPAIKAGTLFVNTGFYKQPDQQGQYESDPEKLGTGVLLIDPDSGDVLGRIPLEAGSVMNAALNFPAMVPNGLTFDRDGSLYIAESGAAADFLQPMQSSTPGVIKIPHSELEKAVAGWSEEAPEPVFIPVPGGPNGVTYVAGNDSVYVVTSGSDDPHQGSIMRWPREHMGDPAHMEWVARGVGALDAVVMTENGTLIASRMAGDLMTRPAGADEWKPLQAAALPAQLESPSDIKLMRLVDGSYALYVPEQHAAAKERWAQSLYVIGLPAGF